MTIAKLRADEGLLQIDAPVSHRNVCVLYAHALYAMRAPVRSQRIREIAGREMSTLSFQVFDSAEELRRVCQAILQLIPQSAGEFRFQSMCRLLASILNKKAEGVSAR